MRRDRARLDRAAAAVAGDTARAESRVRSTRRDRAALSTRPDRCRRATRPPDRLPPFGDSARVRRRAHAGRRGDAGRGVRAGAAGSARAQASNSPSTSPRPCSDIHSRASCCCRWSPPPSPPAPRGSGSPARLGRSQEAGPASRFRSSRRASGRFPAGRPSAAAEAQRALAGSFGPPATVERRTLPEASRWSWPVGHRGFGAGAVIRGNCGYRVADLCPSRALPRRLPVDATAAGLPLPQALANVSAEHMPITRESVDERRIRRFGHHGAPDGAEPAEAGATRSPSGRGARRRCGRCSMPAREPRRARPRSRAPPTS